MKIKLAIKCGVAILFVALITQTAFLQPIQDGLPQITQKYAITGATVITAPGQMLENATILIDDGLIQYVGNNARIEGDAYMVKADSMYIYAGFIDALSHTGVKEPDKGDQPNISDRGNPPNDRAGIQPERTVIDMLSSKEKSIGDMRKLGFTVSHVVPDGRMLPGQGSLILHTGNSSNKMLLQENVSMYSRLRGASGMYPATVIGVMTKFRELYRNAENANVHMKAFKTGGGVERPTYDQSINALAEAIASKKPFYFKASDLKSIYRIMTLQEELGFNLVLTDVKQAWGMEDKLSGSDMPVLVSLDLPEDKSDKKKDTKEEEGEEAEEKREMTMAEKEKAHLEERRAKSLKQHYELAGKLSGAGVPIAFTSVSAKSKDLMPNLRKMVENGLSEDQALAALTTNPAELLNISSYAGTVEKGKMANLVVTNKPFLDEKAQIKYVFVAGDLYEYEVKEEKKKKEKSEGGEVSGDAADVAGTWIFSVETPGGSQSGTIEIENKDGVLSGVIISEGEETELNSVTYENGNLKSSFEMEDSGQSMTIELDLEIDGDTFSGEAIAGPFGALPIEGKKKNPDN